MVKVYRAGSFIKFIKNLYTVEVSTNFRIIQFHKMYSSVRGSLMASGRLLRYNPFSDGGYDPLV